MVNERAGTLVGRRRCWAGEPGSFPQASETRVHQESPGHQKPRAS